MIASPIPLFLQGVKFDIVPSTFEENLKKEDFSSPLAYVTETARHKVLDVVHRLYGTEVKFVLQQCSFAFKTSQ